MKFIKLFLEERRGVGIVEYVLLFALLGTIIAVVAPPVREYVGIMYDNNKDNQSPGETDVVGIDKIDIGPPVEGPTGPVAPPAPGPGYTPPTPGPTLPEITPPEQKEVVVEVIKNTNSFPSTHIYDQEGFYGTLTKLGASVTRKVDTEIFTDTRDVLLTYTKDTEEELESLPTSTEYTDEEGYSGTITASSDIRRVMVPDSSVPIVLTKPSGLVYRTVETTFWSTIDPSSLFPATYSYTEVDPSTETRTGYSGTLSKSGTPKHISTRTEHITDSKNHLHHYSRTEIRTLDTDSPENGFELVSPVRGKSPVNNITYDNKIYHTIPGKVGMEESIMDYMFSGSRYIEETDEYEYYAYYSGVFTPIRYIFPEHFEPTLNYTDDDLYTGTLNLLTNTRKITLTDTNVIKTNGRPEQIRVYAPGFYTLTDEPYDFPDKIDYNETRSKVGNLPSGSGVLTAGLRGFEAVGGGSALYRQFSLYTGTVYSKTVDNIYSFEADYSGVISFSGTNVYRVFQQAYEGTLSKGAYDFAYKYERDYTGTLFKTMSNDIFEYTQKYSGTVTRR